MQKNSTPRILKFFLIGLPLLVLVFFLVWAIATPLTERKIKILNKIPLPIAFVSARPLLANEFVQTRQAVQNFGYSNKEIYSALLRLHQMKVLQQKLSIPSSFNGKNLAEEIENIDADLKIYYYSRPELSPEGHKLAEQLLKRIKNRENFESLSKQFNQDTFSKYFGGDTGQIAYNDMLPEVSVKIKAAEANSTQIFYSREGLHIVSIVSKSQNEVQLKQIFLKPAGFETWLEKELKKIKIIKIIEP